MRRSDWTLLALAAAGGQPVTPVQLQKSLFLLSKECAAEVGEDFYRFEPYNYGPFDSSVYHDAEELCVEQLACEIRSPQRSWAEYAASTEGLKYAVALRGVAPQRAVKYLEAVVDWARRQTFEGLVRAIYNQYPETRARSIFRG
jgi:uncharacterized protein YwgA